MAHRHKGKNGNGAGSQTQTMEGRHFPVQSSETSRSPAMRMMEHPLARLRDEFEAMFDRFLTRWPAASEWGWGTDRFWDVDVQDSDKEIRVRAEAPGFEPKDFEIHVSGNLLTIRAEH